MALQLDMIVFNHDPRSSATSALNIRRNVAATIPVPEWQRGLNIRPEDSLAAYAIEETQGHTISIQARFRALNPQIRSLEVRAISPPPEPFPPWWLQLQLLPLLTWSPAAYYYNLSVYYYWEHTFGRTGNVLGEVAPQQVNFQRNGESPLVTFELQNPTLSRQGVGMHVVTWRWQYRRDEGEAWTDFATTHHKIYTLLSVPTLPWLQAPFSAANTQLPWTDVLDFACLWASSARTPDEAATRITQAVYDLGPELISYDCPGGGLTHYTQLTPIAPFDCTAFLERLHGGLGNGYYVNCVDCATIVSTFANAVGCDLWQSGMGGIFPFLLNPILAIGSLEWETACDWQTFGYHEVAWKGDCNTQDAVFDACLLVDGGPFPDRLPQIPLLPAAIPFGFAGSGQYLDRLVAPAGRVNCQPQPQFTRRRRPVV